jgi:hypothetical protein
MTEAQLTVTPGTSRFRVRVQLIGSRVRPYVWEIVNEETGQVVRRSSGRFRTSAQRGRLARHKGT